MKGSSQGYFAKTKSYDTISLWPSWSCVAMFDHRHLSMTGEATAWGHRKWPEQRLKNCLWESKIAIENGNLWKFICTWVNFHGYVERAMAAGLRHTTRVRTIHLDNFMKITSIVSRVRRRRTWMCQRKNVFLQFLQLYHHFALSK